MPANLKYVVAAAFVVLLYGSVLVHELSHSVVARPSACRCAASCSTRSAGSPRSNGNRPTPGREFLVSAAGPFISLVLAAVGFGLDRAFHPGGVPGVLLSQLVVANLLVGLFNLLPGLPLDGGRMLRAGVWKLTGRPSTATVAAAWAGRALAVAVLLVPLALFLRTGSQVQVFDALWLAVIAAFMWTGATQSLRASRVRERLPGCRHGRSPGGPSRSRPACRWPRRSGGRTPPRRAPW